MNELKVALIGYNEMFFDGETPYEKFSPSITKIVIKSKKDIDDYQSFVMEIAEEYGYIRPVIVSSKDPLFEALNLDSQFNENTRRFNLDDYFNGEETDDDCECYEGDD